MCMTIHCLTGLDLVVLVHANINIISCLVKSNPINLETSYSYSDTSPYDECIMVIVSTYLNQSTNYDHDPARWMGGQQRFLF